MDDKITIDNTPTFLDVREFAIELGVFDPKKPYQRIWDDFTSRQKDQLMTRIANNGHAKP